MKHRRSFAVELKRQIVEELLSGMSTPAQLTLRYEISSGLLSTGINGRFTPEHVADFTGIKNWIKKLLKKGILEKDRKGFLKPAHLSFKLPFIGNITAGFPSPAEEELRDTMSFDEYLINNPTSSFILSVTGDSMVGVNYHEFFS